MPRELHSNSRADISFISGQLQAIPQPRKVLVGHQGHQQLACWLHIQQDLQMWQVSMSRMGTGTSSGNYQGKGQVQCKLILHPAQ